MATKQQQKIVISIVEKCPRYQHQLLLNVRNDPHRLIVCCNVVRKDFFLLKFPLKKSHTLKIDLRGERMGRVSSKNSLDKNISKGNKALFLN